MEKNKLKKEKETWPSCTSASMHVCMHLYVSVHTCMFACAKGVVRMSVCVDVWMYACSNYRTWQQVLSSIFNGENLFFFSPKKFFHFISFVLKEISCIQRKKKQKYSYSCPSICLLTVGQPRQLCWQPSSPLLIYRLVASAHCVRSSCN